MTATRAFVVVITGSECTGKTTLARELADWFGAPWSPEFAREYLDRKGAPLAASDVEPIARGQLAGEDGALARSGGVLVKDTDLVSTVVYAHHYYVACPSWIERAAAERLGDLYLLMHPDVPWIADGLHRDRPADRALLHGLFEDRLRLFGACVVDVAGDWPARRSRALAAVTLACRGQSRL